MFHRGAKAVNYVFLDELTDAVRLRPDYLTLVFDQSLQRGLERQGVGKKLDRLQAAGVSGFAYVSHASFLVLSGDAALSAHALDNLLAQSLLPKARILEPAASGG